MNKFILTLGIAFIANVSFASPANDSLRTCYNKIQATDVTVQTLQREKDVLISEINSLNSTISAQSNEIDSLKSILVETNNSIAALADSLNINISSTLEQIHLYRL